MHYIHKVNFWDNSTCFNLSFEGLFSIGHYQVLWLRKLSMHLLFLKYVQSSSIQYKTKLLLLLHSSNLTLKWKPLNGCNGCFLLIKHILQLAHLVLLLLTMLKLISSIIVMRHHVDLETKPMAAVREVSALIHWAISPQNVSIHLSLLQHCLTSQYFLTMFQFSS